MPVADGMHYAGDVKIWGDVHTSANDTPQQGKWDGMHKEGIITTTSHATHQAMPYQLLLGMVMQMQMALQLRERQRHGRRGNHDL